MANVNVALGGNVYFAISLVIVLVGVAVLFYRYTLPPLPLPRRTVLTVLRSLALVMLLLILFEPILRLVRKDDQKPVVAILVDNSQSMAIRDGAGDRAAAVQQFLKQGNFRGLPSSAVLKYFPFSSKIGPAVDVLPDSLSPGGETTNLSDALAGIKEQIPKVNVRAIVLVSDGNYTAGKNPIYDAEALGIPLYTVGVGDTAEQKDILVEKVVTNNLAYAGTRLPVDVTVKSSGYSGENVEVQLMEGSSILDRKVVKLLEGTHEYEANMFIQPNEEGTKKYTVSVSKLPGELTERNNVRSFFVKVLKSKLRILLFAGAPSPDVAAVRQALVEDERLSLRTFVQKSVNEFYEGPVTSAAIDSSDCLVLVGFPSSATNGAVLRQVLAACEGQRKPVLYIGGKSIDFTRLQVLEPLLPVSFSAPGAGEVAVFPSIPDRQKHHPLVRLEGDVTEESWQRIPPIYKSQTTFRAKAESEVLASVKIQNIVLDEPLVLTRNVARQKSFAITGHGIWRWRLLAQDNPQTEQFLPLLLTNAVRWLTTKEDDKRVRIIPLKETFTTAEPAEFSGQVYDEQARPVDNAEVRVELDHGAEKLQIDLNAVGSGRYEGSVNGLAEGDYAFSGKASADGRVFGEDKGKFSVGQVNVEFIETKMNKQLLEQLAYRTGGTYSGVAASDNIARNIASGAKLESKEILETSEIEVWNWKYLAGIIVLLLAAEWFLRKRNGML